MRRLFLGIACLALQLAAEDFKLPESLEKLSERATETVDVTLDQSTLALASGFLSKDDPDEAQVKKLITKLKGIYVRSFEFDKEGQYSKSDIEALRTQLKGPNWARIVGVKSIKGDNAEIYILKNGDQIGGLVVIDAEPKELTVVYLNGDINPEELRNLGGHMGIPEIYKSEKKNKGDKNQQAKHDKDDEESEMN